MGMIPNQRRRLMNKKNTPKLLKFRGIGRFVIPLCFQWLATFCNSMTSCALQLIVVGDFAMLTWDYSHSIVASLKYIPLHAISLLLVQWVLRRANHFVIGRGDYKMRFLLPFHLICDYSLATTPVFTKGSSRWRFSMDVFSSKRDGGQGTGMNSLKHNG